jgi:glycosyltransferase involved in cell wall biosynthesis
MKILRVHNYYRSATPSGENAVYDAENALLRQGGHELIELTRSNDEAERLRLVTAFEALVLQPWNPGAAQRLRTAVTALSPEVIHVHNTFPLLSPSVLWAAHRSGVGVVCTVHNYRQFCVAAVAMRAGEPCAECLEQRSILPALRYGCFRGSRALALPTAATIALHRHLGTWSSTVDRYIVLSALQRSRLIEAGLPSERIIVKPHFAVRAQPVLPWSERTGGMLFIGRLTHEKGVDLLLRALSSWSNGPPIEIIGDGDRAGALRRLATELGLADRVRFTGFLSQGEAMKRLAQSRLLVIPSRAWETFGMAAIEAYVHGVPVLAADRGALAEVVGKDGCGRLFKAESVDDLRAKLQALWSAPETLAAMADRAVRLAADQYSPEQNLRLLETIYRWAMESAAERGRLQVRGRP